jgi:Bacteriocin-protection, YdeI or OmpD-Associated/Domain of unknown function (DUF1905)
MRFRTTIELGGTTATGFVVPDEVMAGLGGGGRPAVTVTIGPHTYRTTVFSRAGRYLVPLSAENREAAGVAAGDVVDVDLEADTAPREVEVPADLTEALGHDPAARGFFESLSYSHRKEWVRWIEEAKRPETRQRRLESTVSALREGRRTH